MPDTSAFTVPDARGLPGMQGTLRVTVALQCWGLAAIKLLDAGNSPFVLMRALGKNVEPESLAWIDQATGGFLLAAGLLALTRPMWPLLIPVAVVFAADAFGPVGTSPGFVAWAGVAAAAASITAPGSLLLIDWFPPKARFSLARFLIAVLLARHAVALTFAGSGLLAIHESRHAGPLAERLQAIPQTLIDRTLTADAIGWVLALIGAICFAFALNIVTSRSKWLMLGLAAWSLLLSATHLVALGAYGVATLFAEFARIGLPIMLLLYWSRSIEEQREILRTQM